MRKALNVTNGLTLAAVALFLGSQAIARVKPIGKLEAAQAATHEAHKAPATLEPSQAARAAIADPFGLSWQPATQGDLQGERPR